MLNLDNKEYDLNTLFSFEVLKEILLKLARAQVNLEEKVQNIINVYQNKEKVDKENYSINYETDENKDKDKDNDKKLIDKKEDKKIIINSRQSEMTILKKDNTDSQFIENKNTEIEDNNNENDENDNQNETENNEKAIRNEIEDNEKDEKDNKSEIDNKKEEIEETRQEETKKDTEKNEKDYKSESENENENEQKDIKNEVEIIEKDEYEQDNKNEIENKPKQISSNESNKNMSRYNYHDNGLSSDLIKNMSKTIKQNKEKISFLEKEIAVLKKKLNETKKKRDDTEYLNNINKKLEDISSKCSELEERMDNCEVKCSNYDIVTMIKDNGNGTVDATKVIVRALEEKVFKKIEMVETKSKNNSYLNEKLDLIINKIEKDRQNIEKLFNLSAAHKESIDELKNDMNEKSTTIKNNEDKITKLSKKLNDFREKLNTKINELNTKINNNSNAIEELKNRDKEGHIFKLGLGDSQVDKEIIDDINLKINDLRKKVNDLDNSMKLHFENDQIDNLSTKVEKMKLILDKKITKDDLKDLYNLHLHDLDEINDSNNRILSLNEQVKQINSNIKSILKKIDNLNGNLSLIQANQSQSSGSNAPVSNQPIIDFSKYIDNQKLSDTMKPIVKEMEKMFQEVYSLRRELNDVQNANKDLIKQTNLDKLEEKIGDKMNELKITLSKKYLEKVEHYKAIKNLESQIKVQVDDNKKDADSWLMAKRPLKCFNCATCESNIKNITPTNEYLAWNKYPPGDRIYRMGQGFSHMLQMMTTEFVKSIEKNANEIQNENEQSYKNLNLNSITENGRINTHSYANSEKTLLGLSVNNKPQIFEESQMLRKKSGKVRLPLMSKFIKSKKVRNSSDIPVSDEEGDNNDLFEKNKLFGSPKILKIMKKKNANILNFNGLSDNINLNTEANNNLEK